MKSLKLVLIMLIISINILNAQKKKQVEKDTSTTIIIFNHSSSISSPTKKKKYLGESNIIKIAPLGFVSGVIPVYYERKLTDMISIQAGAGLTMRNYLRSLMVKSDLGTIDITNNSQTNDIAAPYYEFTYRKATTGFMYAIQPRVYFDDEGLEGTFIGLSYTNSKFNFNSQGVTSYNLGTAVFNNNMHAEYETLSDIFVTIGSQSLMDKLTTEWTLEFGVRNIKGSKYVAYPKYDNNGNTTVSDGMKDYAKANVFFNIGFKVGLHF